MVEPSPGPEADLAGARIVEIGAVPLVKDAFPGQTSFFSTHVGTAESDPANRRYVVAPSTLPILWRSLHDPGVSLIVCHPTF
jgi:hypothetical protein